MEIIVEGYQEKYVTPDEVIININFIEKDKTYEKVLEKGIKSVSSFMKNVLKKNGFKEEDLKTRNMEIREEKKYNEKDNTYEFVGYSYTQRAILKMAYDKLVIAKLIKAVASMKERVQFYMNFGLQDEEKVKKELLQLAYEDALKKANIIASAAGRELQECLKVDFKPFSSNVISSSEFREEVCRLCSCSEDDLANVLTPEDILVSEHLYCMWKA